MKLLITGASGFIGQYVVQAAVEAGHSVATIGRRAVGDHPFYTYRKDYASVREAFIDVQPDAVLHLATHFVGVHTPDDLDSLVEANIQFGLYLLEAMKQTGCTVLINAASAWQYMENTPYTPNGLYAASKCAFDALIASYLQEAGLRATNLIIYESFGKGDTRAKLIPALLEKIQSGVTNLPLIGPEKGFYVTHASDIANAFLIAAQDAQAAPAGHTHFALRASTAPLTIVDIIDAMSTAWNVALQPQYGAFPMRPNEVLHPPDRIPILPNWSPAVSLEEGFRAMWPADC